ncbi:ABC-2 type transport system ATP-binding protein [Desulfohalotomaculum tongense]|uniref:ABC transporter ATP-binding protein n=1 Tax=Desulforadius tongensis TaxID=1216062 RepID=UPI00195DC6F2|nr:ABC transporter ATP-binding protein [Desulforadius tongensis]MBM7856012.1 ABC-2 type transport system ATP-binding protein [Desulforadius tongensis]
MIEIKNLCKTFGKTEALKNLTLSISDGQVYGLIGPNGAGKTTAMSILATLLPADSGTALVNGLDVSAQPMQVRKIIGYMPDFFGVYDGLTTWEYLSFFASAYYIPENKHDRLINDLLELVNLQDKADSFVDNLSRGMKQRLALARCLVHDPQVLILDEPASGLDPRARAEVKEIIRQLKSMGKTVLISSHILPELAEICDQVGILENGRLVAGGSVAEIINGNQSTRVINVEVDQRLEEMLQFLSTCSGVVRVDRKGSGARLIFRGERRAQSALLKELIEQGYPVLQFAEQTGSLEDAFMAVTGEGKDK